MWCLCVYIVEVELSVGQVSDIVSALTMADTAADAAAGAKYDDPYEENPVSGAVQCVCNGVEEQHKSAAVSRCDVPVCAVSDVCTQQTPTSATCSLPRATAAVTDAVSASVSVPVRSFELSAEYGGFFVDAAVTERAAVQCGAEHQSTVSVHRCDTQPHGATAAGLYDEPWDLSTVKHNIEARLRDSGRPVRDCARPACTDVYAQPRKQPHRTTAGSSSNVADASDGPSYGVLCERVTANGLIAPPSPPPLARRHATTRTCQPATSTWTHDSRPLDDYDVPWDQHKISACKNSKKQPICMA